MMGGGREGEDTLHHGGWEGGRGHPTNETRRGRGRGEDGRGEGRVWGRSACGTVCRASHWEGVRGREKGEGEGGGAQEVKGVSTVCRNTGGGRVKSTMRPLATCWLCLCEGSRIAITLF